MHALRTPEERFHDLPGFPYQARFVEVPDPEGGPPLRMGYVDEGPRDAAPILMLHGEPSWSFLYRKVIAVVTAAGHRAVAPDLIGFGRSDKPARREDYTYERHVAWVAAFLEALDLKRVTLLCQDWGGLIGLRLVAEHPERFDRIVAANTFLPTGAEKPGEAFLAWRQFSQTVPEFPVSRIIAGACTKPLAPEVLRAYDAPFPDETFKAGARQFPLLVPIAPDDPASAANRRAWEVLSRWEKPFLTAFGDRDPITKGADAALQARIPGTRGQAHVTLAGAAHFLQEDEGEALGQVVAAFVDRRGGGLGVSPRRERAESGERGGAGVERALEAGVDGGNLGAADGGARAGALGQIERGAGEQDRQRGEPDHAAGGAGGLEGEHVLGGGVEVGAGEREDLGSGQVGGQVDAAVARVGVGVFEDVDELEALAEARGAVGEGLPGALERGGEVEEELGEQLADDAGHDVAVVLEIAEGAQAEVAVLAAGGDEARHALRGAQRVAHDGRAPRRLDAGQLAEHAGHRGEQLEVAVVIAGAGAHPGGGERVGHVARGRGEQAIEGAQRRQPIGAGPAGGVLEGVGDAEEQVGHADLAPQRLRQLGDGEREGPAGAEEEPVDVCHGPYRAGRPPIVHRNVDGTSTQVSGGYVHWTRVNRTGLIEFGAATEKADEARRSSESSLTFVNRTFVSVRLVSGGFSAEKCGLATWALAPARGDCQSKFETNSDEECLQRWFSWSRAHGAMERAEVVIVGGGFAGLCAARALRGMGRVVVLEARTGTDPRFRGELIHPPGVRILAELGLHDALRDAGGADVEGFAVVLENAVPPIVLPYAEVKGGAPHGLAISHPDMVARLRKEVVGGSVELRTGVRVAELVYEGDRVVGVKTADGGEIHAPLTVVAEGRHSKLRRALGFADETRLLSFTAALLVEGELPRPTYGHVFLGTWGPILAYAIGGGRVRMCIDLPVDTGKGQEAVEAFLRTECAPSVPEPLRSGMLRALVEAPPEICANHAIKTRRCAARGIALVGDSGGCSHPITATGMTVALNDIRTLATELERGGGVDAALERYQAARYDFVRAREVLADGLYDVFRRGDDGARVVRSGLSRYWTSGARARAASLALLSGQESRLRAFVAEYLWVVGESAVSVLGGGIDASVPGGRRAAFTGLARTAYDQLQRTGALLYTEILRRATPEPRGLAGRPKKQPAKRGAGEDLMA